MKPITVMIRGALTDVTLRNLERLADQELVEGFLLLTPPSGADAPARVGDVPCTSLGTELPDSTGVVKRVLDHVATPYLLAVDASGALFPVPRCLRRLVEVARSTGALLTYGDFQQVRLAALDPDTGSARGDLELHPLADYQEGSVGDRFDFGPLALWSTEELALAMGRHGPPPADLRWHAWYDLRLKGSINAPLVRLPEPLAIREPWDARRSGAAVFDYLTAGREVQREAERVLADHLRRIGAHLSGPFRPFVSAGHYPVEASVVIPVRDRVLTVADAVESALSQRASFPYNVIVIDNHSSDGTTGVLEEIADREPRLQHRVPTRRDLGIGGCWNEAINDAACGRFVVQLDSDDLYAAPDVLERIVRRLRDDRCGMVIGSYTTVDLSLATVPPGLVDHREWTDHNGPNNALRVDGLGAPRAFATALVRRYPFPNVSYGEDYAVALRVCREYRVGRIYESLYHCRRWEDNTDADLSPEARARHQTYKDRIRTVEIGARRRLNLAGEARA